MSDRPSRQQLRRHARRLRHDGYQPMIVLNSGDQIPETAAAQIARTIWRYRSELAPMIVAVLVMLCAAGIHRAAPESWPFIALAALIATTCFTVSPPHWARKAWTLLDRPAERAY